MKRFILTAVSFMTLLCSCENFIDLQPMDKITMDDYWSTSTELEYYTRQFYPFILSLDTDGCGDGNG